MVFSPHPSPVPTSQTSPGLRSPADALEECLEQTAAILHNLRAATPAELTRGIDAVRQSHADGHPGDLIEAIAHLQGNPPEKLASAMLHLAEKIAHTLTPFPPLVPFAGKLITPTAFYESYPEIHQLSKTLLSPVIYAEDTDAIGTASLNPIAASIVAEEILAAVHRRTGIRPFVSTVLLDYESWSGLTRKHFIR